MNTTTNLMVGDRVRWTVIPAADGEPAWVRSGTLQERHTFGDNTVWLIETETGPATASELDLTVVGR